MFDRLQCIIDTEDPRFERLKAENIKFWEHVSLIYLSDALYWFDIFRTTKWYNMQVLKRGSK